MPATPIPPRRVLRLPEVIKRTGLQRDTIYRGGREGWFPKVVKLTERASGWIESEVDAYIERIAGQRDVELPPSGRDVRPR